MNIGAQPKPTVLWDGDCGFCRFWVLRYKSYTENRVKYSTFQESAADFPQIPRERLAQAVHLVDQDGTVRFGADAIFRLMAYRPLWRWIPRIYDRTPLIRKISEWGYRLIATHRSFFGFWTRVLWGRPQPDSFFVGRTLFLKLLGVVYFAAFLSLWVQIDGLVGPNGILPAGPFLDAVHQHYGVAGFYLLPSVFWWSVGSSALHFACGLGLLVSILLVVGCWEALSLFIAWALYLSFISIGREFLSFQWDVLLLETGLIALFLVPFSWRPLGRAFRPAATVLLLLRWLLFRLIFMSGMVKLLSHDPNWANLSALSFHYQTQPLPNGISWYVQQLPAAFHRFCCAGMFVIELIVPFLIFGPRRLRKIAAYAILILQIFIRLTGNYAFFNGLAIALCLILIDDASFPVWLRRWCRLNERKPSSRGWPGWILFPFAAISLLVSGFMFTNRLGFRFPWPPPTLTLAQVTLPFHSFNPYGLFAVMTTQRLEIEIQGTSDGKTWRAYEFRYKPGDIHRRPRFVAPHQPRLDWQMWFAALSSAQDNPWILSAAARLLQGSPEVLRLFDSNPFPDAPPGAVRAVLYEYRFTTPEERRETHAWWHRIEKGLYFPPIRLNGQKLEPVG
jgi:predicted DCC family thiol-disulfide oxidoreductase YuxK